MIRMNALKMHVAVAGLLATVVAAPTHAQGCAGVGSDACQKGLDLVKYMTPQFAAALAIGNPTLGQGGTLGGFGRFSFDVRMSSVSGSLPPVSSIGLSTTLASSNITTNRQQLSSASMDLGIGLWRGYSLGDTHLGGVDAIAIMTYMTGIRSPTSNYSGLNNANVNDITVHGGDARFGYGFRVGLLQESATIPGVSISWVKRDVPTVSFGGVVGGFAGGGIIELDDFSVKTASWRATAAKSLGDFGFSIGLGQDSYDASATVLGAVFGIAGTGTQPPGSFSMTRTNMFVDAFINLSICRLEGEYGQLSGGTVSTVNTFDTDAAASRRYFTVGLRFGR
jgi:hypothetical protein